MKINTCAYAKINWYLEILNKRKDGYHNISTLMQLINLADKLSFKSAKNEIILKSTSKDLENEENLVFKAACILKEYTNTKKGVDIFLEKRIPIGAGLAGGSADAACALKSLNQLWELNLKEKELYNLALQLGSDVAFHLQGGLAKAQGRGEILNFLNFSPLLNLILIYPNFKISTPWAYQVYDNFLKNKKVNFKKNQLNLLIKNLRLGNLKEIAQYLRNDFEEVIFKNFPTLKEIKEKLFDLGALQALLSGSGSAIFGILPDKKTSQKIFNFFNPQKFQIFKVSTIK